MVLKRKRGDEFIAYEPQGATSAAVVPSPPKKTRRNPPRSKGSATTSAEQPMMSYSGDTAPPPTAVKRHAPAKKKTAATPSSSSRAGPSQPSAPAPKPKGKKKAVDEDADDGQSEKRKAQFKPKCPQNILDRVERVMYQRMFMIDRTRNGDELREQYSILGSTGNVYIVTIDHVPHCNCPDAFKGNHCKHILFVFLKVLQVSQASGHWYQKALLTSELEEIFREAPLAPQARADRRIIDEYNRATGKTPVAAEKSSGNKRIPGEDDDCPICYDGMQGTPEAKLVFCEQCGNALHTECFGEWRKTAQRNNKELTCVWCRGPWVVSAPAGAASGAKKSGYLNLAGVAGMSQRRDTTSYYHGPRGGNRYYGYQMYDD